MALMYTCIRMLFILMYVLFKSKILTLVTIGYIVGFIVGMYIRVLFVGPRGRIGNIYCILDYLGQVYAGTVFW